MCGIIAIFKSNVPIKQKILKASQSLRHRGPDASGIQHGEQNGTFWAIAHERLAIMDPRSGAQPFSTDKTILAVNGEIYNYLSIITDNEKTCSDCEVILTNYENGIQDERLIQMLDGVFAFVLMDKETGNIIVARDAVGVMPLYYGYGYDGSIAFASEMKALKGLVGSVRIFPPGHMFTKGQLIPIPNVHITPTNYMIQSLDDSDHLTNIKDKLQSAVVKRTMSHVPWGLLLSGGLDSSIVSAIAALNIKKLNTFCIGLEGSQDCKAAELMAKAIESNHTTFTFTKEEGWDAIRDVIYHLETYDVTTIRAGTPMYLLARKIRAMGIKMVLSGEGSDEIFGGYLYFHNCPDAKAFQKETYDKLKALHQYDCLRANKAMAAFGVETRVPFLDKDFVKYVMRKVPAEKRMVQNSLEKYILREAFKDFNIPDEILWRQKEQFSDGVGYSWIDFLKSNTEKYRKLLPMSSDFFPIHTPKTPEAFYYRMIFEELFPVPGAALTVPYEDSCACSTGNAALWSGNEIKDASGRSVKVHTSVKGI